MTQGIFSRAELLRYVFDGFFNLTGFKTLYADSYALVSAINDRAYSLKVR